jgi:two-component system nitrate/nitrite response regulator NarL
MRRSARIVLADRQTLFLDVLTWVLTVEGHSVLAAVTNRHALVEAVRRTGPDTCLIDSAFPDGDVTATVADVLDACPDGRVVVLTSDAAADTMSRALSAGATGFVHKTRGLGAVLSALDRVAAGARVAVDGIPAPEPRDPSPERRHMWRLAGFLTPRELECLRLLTTGQDTAEMARTLGVSSATVRSHVQSILSKLGAHSRLEAASLALRHGLLANA